MFCSSNERKMECPPEKITMNIDKDFMQFKKENEADDQNTRTQKETKKLL